MCKQLTRGIWHNYLKAWAFLLNYRTRHHYVNSIQAWHDSILLSENHVILCKFTFLCMLPSWNWIFIEVQYVVDLVIHITECIPAPLVEFHKFRVLFIYSWFSFFWMIKFFFWRLSSISCNWTINERLIRFYLGP
jgi:hypothetical protein